MKLIKHSVLKDPEGIRVTCVCGAEYIIEDRSDWDGEYVQTYNDCNHVVNAYEYKSRCPECGVKKYHGIDYHIFPVVVHHIIFDREDWAERFRMPHDGRKVYQ